MTSSRVKPLSDMQRKFVAEYIRTGNGTQSAIKAGYAPAGAHTAACRLLKHSSVIKALDRVAQKADDKDELTAAKVLRDIEETRQLAMESEAYGHALKASELQGKALKMWFENHTVETKQAAMSDDQLRARLAELGVAPALPVVVEPQADEPEHVTH